jgi:hypothetical protein
MEVLLKLAADNKIFSDLVHVRSFSIQGDKFRSSSILHFKKHLLSLRGNLGHSLRSIHPELSMSAYFVKGNFNKKILHVLRKSKHKCLLEPLQVMSDLTKLHKAINYLYLKSYKHFDIKEDEYKESRERLFECLTGKLVSSQDSTPLFGYYESEDRFAPWEGEKNRNWKGFQEIQIQLIKFFSEQQNPLTLEETAGFVLTVWYQENHPQGFENLVKITNQLLL